jgi:molybdate transport system substrate-binding protein
MRNIEDNNVRTKLHVAASLALGALLQGAPSQAVAAAAAAAAVAAPRTLTVAAAANLEPVLRELVPEFEAANPGATVRTTLGASGRFFAQIRQGAPFDVFLAADAIFPARLVEAGFASGPAFAYALGRLAVWVPSDSRVDLEKAGLRALIDPSIRKVALGNPAVAPYGLAAEEAMRTAGVLEAVKGKWVLGESVGQAAQFALGGAAQAAFLPLSLALAPPLSTLGRHLLLPASSHRPIEQAGVIVKGAREPELARAFVAWLLGPDGRATLARHGYESPPR